MAERLLAELDDERVVTALVDSIARHAGSLDALVAVASMGEAHADAVLEAGERWCDEQEQTSLARAVIKTGHGRLRERAAAKLLPAAALPQDRLLRTT